MKRCFSKYSIQSAGIILLCFLLIGCNYQKSSSALIKDNRDIYANQKLNRQVITFFFQGNEPDGVKKVFTTIEKELENTLNVKLNFRWFPEGVYKENIKRAIESNADLDAFVLTKDDFQDEIQAMGKEGYLQDLGAILKEVAPTLYNTYTSEERENTTYDNRLLAIPQHYPRSNQICALIRNEAIKQVETQDFNNYNDFEKFLDNISQGTGFRPTVIDKNSLDIFAQACGYVHLDNYFVYKWDDPEMKLIPWEQTPEFKDCIETIMRWKENGYISNYMWEGKNNFYDPTAYEVFNRNDTAAMLTTWDNIQYYIENFQEKGSNFTVYPINIDKISQKSSSTVGIVINKHSKNVERVLKFLEWIQSSQENYDLFMYGIKDVNYELVGNKVSFPANKTKFYGWDGSQAFLNINYLREDVSGIPDYKEKYVKIFDENSRYAPSNGFRMNTGSIEKILELRKKKFDDFQDKIHYDDIDVDKDIDNFINDQKAIGTEDAVIRIQKQLDEWRKKKKN